MALRNVAKEALSALQSSRVHMGALAQAPSTASAAYHSYPYIKPKADGTYPDKEEEIEQIIKIVSPYAVMPQGTYMGWPEKETFKRRLEWLRDNLGITGDAAVKVSTRLHWFPRSEFPMEDYEGWWTKKTLNKKLGWLKGALGAGGAGRLVALVPGTLSFLLYI